MICSDVKGQRRQPLPVCCCCVRSDVLKPRHNQNISCQKIDELFWKPSRRDIIVWLGGTNAFVGYLGPEEQMLGGWCGTDPQNWLFFLITNYCLFLSGIFQIVLDPKRPQIHELPSMWLHKIMQIWSSNSAKKVEQAAVVSNQLIRLRWNKHEERIFHGARIGELLVLGNSLTGLACLCFPTIFPLNQLKLHKRFVLHNEKANCPLRLLKRTASIPDEHLHTHFKAAGSFLSKMDISLFTNICFHKYNPRSWDFASVFPIHTDGARNI